MASGSDPGGGGGLQINEMRNIYFSQNTSSHLSKVSLNLRKIGHHCMNLHLRHDLRLEKLPL